MPKLSGSFSQLDKSNQLNEEHRIFSKLCKVIDLYDVLKILVEELVSQGEFDGVTVDLIDEKRIYMVCEMAHLPSEYKAMEGTYRMLRVPLEAYEGRIEDLAKGAALIFKEKDIHQYSSSVSNQMQRWQVKSQMVLPIIYNDSSDSGVLVGVVTVFYQQLDDMPDRMIDKIQRIISYFTNSIYNAKQYSGLKRQQKSIMFAVEEQQRFLNFVSDVNNLTSPSSIYELFCNEFIHRFTFDVAGIFMEEEGRLVCKKNVVSERYESKLPEWDDFTKKVSYELELSAGAIVVSYLREIHVYVRDIPKIMHLPMSENDREGLEALKEPTTLVCMPIKWRDKVYGCLWLWSINKQIVLSDSDIAIIKYLCEFIGTAINNSLLYETIENQNRKIKASKQEIESLYFDLEKKSEAELRHLRNYLSNIIDSMPSILIAVDANGVISQWNKTAEQVTGISVRSARGNVLSDVLPYMNSEMGKIKDSIKRHEVEYKRNVVRQDCGEVEYQDVTIYPLISDVTEGAVIRIDDVTEKVRMEAMMIQSEKMLSVGGLAAGMAHEINNPLAGMLQTANVLKNRLCEGMNLPANQKVADELGFDLNGIEEFMEKRGIPRMLDTVSDSGKRVAHIVTNMLSFARKSDDSKTPQNISELIDKTLELADVDYNIEKQYDFKLVKVIKKYEKQLPLVPCEVEKIQQVLLNLFRNGAQAMLMDGVQEPCLMIKTHFEKRTGFVVIEVEDNGPGIDEYTRKRIFEPFFTTKPVGIGTGLGLSVSYFIITENHCGEMSVKSRPNKGAKFIIKLPIKEKRKRS